MSQKGTGEGGRHGKARGTGVVKEKKLIV